MDENQYRIIQIKEKMDRLREQGKADTQEYYDLDDELYRLVTGKDPNA